MLNFGGASRIARDIVYPWFILLKMGQVLTKLYHHLCDMSVCDRLGTIPRVPDNGRVVCVIKRVADCSNNKFQELHAINACMSFSRIFYQETTRSGHIQTLRNV